jgi:hypothetical protein
VSGFYKYGDEPAFTGATELVLCIWMCCLSTTNLACHEVTEFNLYCHTTHCTLFHSVLTASITGRKQS